MGISYSPRVYGGSSAAGGPGASSSITLSGVQGVITTKDGNVWLIDGTSLLKKNQDAHVSSVTFPDQSQMLTALSGSSAIDQNLKHLDVVTDYRNHLSPVYSCSTNEDYYVTASDYSSTAFQALDGDYITSWYCDFSSDPIWISVSGVAENVDPFQATAYRFCVRAASAPKNFIFQGSLGEDVWEDLDSTYAELLAPNLLSDYTYSPWIPMSISQSYLAYRLYITGVWNDSSVDIVILEISSNDQVTQLIPLSVYLDELGSKLPAVMADGEILISNGTDGVWEGVLNPYLTVSQLTLTNGDVSIQTSINTDGAALFAGDLIITGHLSGSYIQLVPPAGPPGSILMCSGVDTGGHGDSNNPIYDNTWVASDHSRFVAASGTFTEGIGINDIRIQDNMINYSDSSQGLGFSHGNDYITVTTTSGEDPTKKFLSLYAGDTLSSLDIIPTLIQSHETGVREIGNDYPSTNNTIIARVASQKLENSKPITKIGFYTTAPGDITFKVGKATGTTQNYTDVTDVGTFTHTGNGWQEFTLLSPFTVPDTGDWYPALFSSHSLNNSLFYTEIDTDRISNITGNVTGSVSFSGYFAATNLAMYVKYDPVTIHIGTLYSPDLVYTGDLNPIAETIPVAYTAASSMTLFITSSDQTSKDTYSITGRLADVELLRRDQDARVASVIFPDNTTLTTAASGISGVFSVTESGGSFDWTFINGVLTDRQPTVGI